mmetsp:Transcript_5321/g.8791  ORF Transcript_5321/g.8791 Transcript_5321/m.8791 type:complete len:183 (-) Transcript_5321:181-729(-)
MNNIGVAVTTMGAVIFTTIFASNQSITALDTMIAPEFFLTSIVAAFSFGGAVYALILVTLSTLFHIHAVWTEPFITSTAAPLPTAMKAVTPITDAAQFTHTISAPKAPNTILHTILTVVFHTIIASDILCRIFMFYIGRHFQHSIVFGKIFITFQASNYSAAQQFLVSVKKIIKILTGAYIF